jgi:hypothetical protein
MLPPVRRIPACLAAGILACSSDPAAPPDATVDARVDVAPDVAPDEPAPDAPPPWRCVRNRRPPAEPAQCNGAASLCARRYDRVAYATTHNAMSSEEDRFAAPNQNFGLTRQLRDGVRGLMLDAHPWRDDLWLCHGICLAGRRRLAEGLCDVGRYLDEDPGAVVTILFESYLDAAQMETAFREADLLDDVFAQPAGAPWPTLGEFVRSGRRLVVFTDRDDDAASWYHDVWAYAQENPYAATTPSALSCAQNRGASTNALFILNHFLTAPLASPELARMVNFNPALLDHARRCQRERMRFPNFVTVDFYDLGDLMPTVSALNAM